jgi:hypothetical protein
MRGVIVHMLEGHYVDIISWWYFDENAEINDSSINHILYDNR